jgi:subtilase family serine protease
MGITDSTRLIRLRFRQARLRSARWRGVPDVALQSGARTSALIYISLPPDGPAWYIIGGTSLATPQWAGLVAIAAQIKGGGLGPINAALYTLAAGPNYATYLYDVTTGNNQTNATVPGYPATNGWDPVTGLGITYP